MSAMDAFNTPTTAALGVSISVIEAPVGGLTNSVLPSTFSMVPRTRCVCCAEAVVTANAAANAATVKIRVVFI